MIFWGFAYWPNVSDRTPFRFAPIFYDLARFRICLLMRLGAGCLELAVRVWVAVAISKDTA
jgi:hypothetical protein